MGIRGIPTSSGLPPEQKGPASLQALLLAGADAGHRHWKRAPSALPQGVKGAGSPAPSKNWMLASQVKVLPEVSCKSPVTSAEPSKVPVSFQP